MVPDRYLQNRWDGTEEAELHEQNVNNNQPQGYHSRDKYVGRHWYAYCKEWARLDFAIPRYSQMMGAPEKLPRYRHQAFSVLWKRNQLYPLNTTINNIISLVRSSCLGSWWPIWWSEERFNQFVGGGNATSSVSYRLILKSNIWTQIK